MKLQIAVNKHCKNKTNPHKVADGWLNISEDVDWLSGWVKAGYGWVSTHFANRYRLSENCCGSNLVVVDIDGDTTLARFWATDTARNWCICTYTSSSHSEQEHRFRALFPLGRTLGSVNEHRGAYWLIVNRLLAELQLETLKDNCGQKPERLWYGNTNAVFEFNQAFVAVPQFLLDDIGFEEKIFQPTEVTAVDIERCQWLLDHLITPSEDGEYETVYLPVTAACAALGGGVFDTWANWVLRGHHGEKPENIKAFKWKGLGGRSGPSKIYAMAKAQDPSWSRALPEHLKFKGQFAAGYSEFDPVFEPHTFSLSDRYMSKDNGRKEFLDELVLEPVPDVQLKSKTKGRGKKTSDDLAKERQDDAAKLSGVLLDLRQNRLTKAIEYTDDSGRFHVLEGSDLDLMTTKLAIENGLFIPEARMKAGIQYAAGANSYCPITRYLDQCSIHAIPHADWDRIGEIFLGNPHKLATTALQRLMIGAVARAYKPGVSMSWLPILVGPQGVGKSMFARHLVPDDLFAEMSTPLETLMKEQYRLHVAWLLELPEIDSYFHSRNIENFKNLITTRCDEVRRPYASLPERLPRRFVMIGTTNRNQFLVDSTGNRRFVPLEIAGGFTIPWKQLKDERDCLWASAIRAYHEGISYEFTSGEIAAMHEYIQEFGDPDPWAEKITDYCASREEVSCAEVLTKALELDPRSQSRRESRRVSDVLQTLGWRRFVTTRKDKMSGKKKSVRIWQRPENDPIDESHILNDF